MSKITVCAVGFDGLDICVAENIRKFYIELGCRIIISNTPLSADILVILRGMVPKLDCQSYQQVHMYNYVGQDRSQMLLENVNKLICLEAAPSLSKLRPILRPPIVVKNIQTWHPVYPSIWKLSICEPDYGVTHVGNYKPIKKNEPDVVQAELLSALKIDSGYVWGRGWQNHLPLRLTRGPVSLWKVPRIFSRSIVTLGVRYPYQREHNLISSRLWMAPINGCPVVSQEPSISFELPGVYFANYSSAVTQYGINCKIERKQLALQAEQFWANHTADVFRQIAIYMEDVKALTRWNTKHLSANFVYILKISLRKLKSAFE